MSWRQPPKRRTNAKDAKHAKKFFTREFLAFATFAFERFLLIRNGRHLSRTERFQIAPRLLDVELRVARLDAQEEAVAAGEREPRHVEHRGIRLRQAVQREDGG